MRLMPAATSGWEIQALLSQDGKAGHSAKSRGGSCAHITAIKVKLFTSCLVVCRVPLSTVSAGYLEVLDSPWLTANCHLHLDREGVNIWRG